MICRDEATGSFGAVICSSSPAVAARCVHMADGSGAVLSQNVTDPRLGARVLDLLGAGVGAAESIAMTVGGDPFADWR
jgi:uncharacterized Ntn-hydrolase superfamily protein